MKPEGRRQHYVSDYTAHNGTMSGERAIENDLGKNAVVTYWTCCHNVCLEGLRKTTITDVPAGNSN